MQFVYRKTIYAYKLNQITVQVRILMYFRDEAIQHFIDHSESEVHNKNMSGQVRNYQ